MDIFNYFLKHCQSQQAEIKSEVKAEIDETAGRHSNDDDDLHRRLERGFDKQFFTEGRLNAVGAAFHKFVRSPRKYFADNNELNDAGVKLLEIFTPSLRQLDN